MHAGGIRGRVVAVGFGVSRAGGARAGPLAPLAPPPGRLAVSPAPHLIWVAGWASVIVARVVPRCTAEYLPALELYTLNVCTLERMTFARHEFGVETLECKHFGM